MNIRVSDYPFLNSSNPSRTSNLIRYTHNNNHQSPCRRAVIHHFGESGASPLSMSPQRSYTASDYVRDNGFPLSWMCRCCLGTGRAHSGVEQEFSEYQQRTKPKPGTVIGRPAGREAYHGRSATMVYQQQQSRNRPEQTTPRDDKSGVETTSET